MYKTIYADPPYNETGGGKIKRGADRHYELLKTYKIIEYMRAIPIDDDAHLYLWVTNNFLKDGLKIIDKLGFRYITNRVWVKDKFGLGQYFRGQHEILLFAVKGKLPFKNKVDCNRSKCNVSSVIRGKRTKHSKKPSSVYVDIENISYPPYLEVFAREHRQGWDVWGKEIPDTIQNLLDI